MVKAWYVFWSLVNLFVVDKIFAFRDEEIEAFS
jgi:hypothetical protein